MTDPVAGSVVLRPPHPYFSLANLRAWAGLAGTLAIRNFRVRFLRLRLGLLWPILQPTLQALLLAVVFVKIFGVRGIAHYPLYVLSGVMTWQCFQQCVMQGMVASIENGSLVKKVPVPISIFPVAAVGGQLLVFGIQSVVLIVGAVLAGTAGFTLLLLPVGLALQTLLALGLALLIGAYLPSIRDLRLATESALLMAFYATPIMYEPSRLPESVRSIVRLNPATGMMSLHRAALLGRPIDWVAVAITCAVTVPLLLVGLVVYRRRSRLFADML